MNRTLLFLTLLLGSVAFAQDVHNPQTNASQLTTGTVASARGGAGTINGALKGNGAGVVSQAACADLSNASASCATDATNASNISSGTLNAARGGTGINSLGAGVATFLGTPSSANLAAAVTGETGSGALVFGTAPTIADPVITGAWNVAANQTIGDGTTSKGLLIRGATSGAANGSFIDFNLGINYIGEHSAILGGSYDSSMMFFNSSGVYLMYSLVQTAAAQSGTMCYSNTLGTITYDASVSCLSSSMRFKHDWRPLSSSLDKVLRLEVGSFLYNDAEATPGEQIGLNAENMANVDTRLVAYDPDGRPRAVRYLNTIALLVKAIQEQQEQIEILKAK